MGRVGIEPTTLGLKGLRRALVERTFPRKINNLQDLSARERSLALVCAVTSFVTWPVARPLVDPGPETAVLGQFLANSRQTRVEPRQNIIHDDFLADIV